MRSRGQRPDGAASFRALVVLNVLLLGLLALVTFGPAAEAQLRARGEYAMAAGFVQGLDGKAVYIIDAVNQEMLAVTYDPNAKHLDGIGYRHLGVDAAEVARGVSGSN